MPRPQTAYERLSNVFRDRIADILRREANNRPDADPRNLRKDRTNGRVFDKIIEEGRTNSDKPLTKWERSKLRDIINEERLRRNTISQFERQERQKPIKGPTGPQDSYDAEVIIERVDPVIGKKHRERRWIEDQRDISESGIKERVEADQANEDTPYVGGMSSLPPWLDLGTFKISKIIILDIVIRK